MSFAPTLSIETPSPARQAGWPAWQLLAFRFCASYFFLDGIPWPLGVLPGTAWINDPWSKGEDAIVLWVAHHLLRFPTVSTIENGSGDRTFDFAYRFTLIALSILACAIWSFADRRAAHPRLHAAVRTYVRYSLCAAMIGYGVAKLGSNGQFPSPSPARLLEPVGAMTPMGLLWTFMGQSQAYCTFGGALELLGALLLLSRRTTLLGALVLAGVMGNVVMLNFCYDVPVKLYSSSLLFSALFLAAPDASRLFDLFVRNRRVEPAAEAPLVEGAWLRRAAFALKVVLVGAIAWGNLSGFRARNGMRVEPEIRSLSGTFESQDSDFAPRAWRRVGFGVYDIGVLRTDGTFDRMSMKYDPPHQQVTIRRRGDPKPATLSLARNGDQVELNGMIGDEVIRVRLKRVEQAKFALTSRGFRWINEYPDNR